MKLANTLLTLLNRLLSFALALVFAAALAWAGYGLWDGYQTQKNALDVQESLRRLRPLPENAEAENADADSPGFADLLALNPDICAWLILPNTNIDYPVVQGRTNMDYLSRDAYGNYDLSGSIFLDFRNSRGFDDAVQVLYGHHVNNSSDNEKGKEESKEARFMFTDLLKYRNADFFDKNREGLLLLPDGEKKLHLFACLQTTAGEDLIFDPEYAAENRSRLLDYAQEHAEQADTEAIDALRGGSEKILSMTTCTIGAHDPDEDARTVVLAWMEEAS